jgi:pimeloyl-ACP methyl ester carboxylesterase
LITHYGGFPAFDILYDTTGNLVDPTAEAEALAYFSSTDGDPITDVAVISHGWNNDIGEARILYAGFFAAFRSVLTPDWQAPAGTRNLAVVGIFWPSKKFADSDLIPGGAASLNSADTKLNLQLDMLAELFAADPSSKSKIEHAREQIPKLEVSQSAQDDFVFALNSVIPKPRGEGDQGLDEARLAIDSTSSPGHVVLSHLAAPVFPVFPTPISGGGAASIQSFGGAGMGQAAGLLGDLSSGIKAGASRLLNYFTYYTMKDRAGIVGGTGATNTIQKIVALNSTRKVPRKVHIIGHSFGARLVTSAANALPAGVRLDSMLLLEAAYSHDGMAQNWDGQGHDGAFRAVLAAPKIAGPVLITHSVHDTAVGIAYPLASRILSQTAAAIGDANDKFGGMGRNGAQHTPEAFDDILLDTKGGYKPAPAGKFVRNLNGDGPDPKPTIHNHGDVAKPEIAKAWMDSI